MRDGRQKLLVGVRGKTEAIAALVQELVATMPAQTGRETDTTTVDRPSERARLTTY